MDFDRDGRLDIVTATYDGSPHVALGKGGRFDSPQHILDGNGKRIITGMYWDYDQEEWCDNHLDHCVSAVAFDWDDDGDFDLLLGTYSGELFRQENLGQENFTGVNFAVRAGGHPLKIKGGLTAPRLVDWNRDGLIDLVCGGFAGGAFLFLNHGKKGAPRLGEAITLITPPQTKEDVPSGPTRACYVDPVDLDQDGDLDLVLGGYEEWMPQSPILSEAEKKQYDTAVQKKAELSAIYNEKYQANYRSMAGKSKKEIAAAQDDFLGTEEMQALQRQLAAVWAEMAPFEARPMSVAKVWIYRQESPNEEATPKAIGGKSALW